MTSPGRALTMEEADGSGFARSRTEGDMNLVERVKNILVDPKAEWPQIRREPGDIVFLFANYVAVLAAIPAICGWIAWIVGGGPVVTGVLVTLVRYALSFASVYLLALMIDALAPTFEATKSFDNALKLAVFSATPFWLSGILSLLPGLGFVRILVLIYSAYLLWLGIPPLMRAPQDKALAYTGAVAACAVAIGIVFLVVAGLLGISRPF